MAKKPIEAPEWFFAWAAPRNKQYITSICAWTKKDLIELVVRENGSHWTIIHGKGGRAVKCQVTPLEPIE